MITIAVLGLGSRGKNYGNKLAKTEGVKITAVCDKYPSKIDRIKNNWGVPDEMCFTSDTEFFNKGKIADAVVIATQDRDHYGHAMKALELGYNILVEKPVSPSVEECIEIERYSRERGLKVLVCHVLRYATYYRKIKEIIDSGALGQVIDIRHSENIGYWHFAHSYVRGNWRREDQTSPMLLAKCCHDMDLLYWFTGSKCKSLSSYGDLKYFTLANAPEGCGDNCFECKYQKTCHFDAEYYYVGRKKFIGRSMRKFLWGTYAFSNSYKTSAVLNSLKNDERGKLWARCVWKCDNDVADNQKVLMEMENGIICSFTVNAFNEKNHRHLEIRGTKGELYADDKGSVMTFKPFDKPAKKIRTSPLSLLKGHSGGDQGIVKAVVSMLKDEPDPSVGYTWISDSIESHRIVSAAELSRHEGGRKVDMSEIPDVK